MVEVVSQDVWAKNAARRYPMCGEAHVSVACSNRGIPGEYVYCVAAATRYGGPEGCYYLKTKFFYFSDDNDRINWHDKLLDNSGGFEVSRLGSINGDLLSAVREIDRTCDLRSISYDRFGGAVVADFISQNWKSTGGTKPEFVAWSSAFKDVDKLYGPIGSVLDAGRVWHSDNPILNEQMRSTRWEMLGGLKNLVCFSGRHPSRGSLAEMCSLFPVVGVLASMRALWPLVEADAKKSAADARVRAVINESSAKFAELAVALRECAAKLGAMGRVGS